jgi:glycosyltransferase involved in cell wall biosynthesis
MIESLSLDPNRPTAVRLVDIDANTLAIQDYGGYDRVMLYFLLQGSIVGKAILPVIAGKIPSDALQAHVDRVTRDAADSTATIPRRSALSQALSLSASVIVCTRDRAPILRGCLQSLLALEWANPQIAVVDNSAHPEETRLLVQEFPSILYVRCGRAGLDRARNAGIKATTGELIAFTDDDARVHPAWLKGLARNFYDPLVAVTTGITLPERLDTRAVIEFEMTSPFAKGYHRKEFTLTNVNMMNVASIGAGVNMAIRRSSLGEIGLFDEHLDGGTPTISGGDHEFFYRTITRGYRVVYDPAAIALHQHRETSDAAIRTVFGYGVGVLGWWTRSLVMEGEFSVLLRAPICIMQYHLRRVLDSLRGMPGAPPLVFALAELRGALSGPFAYIRSLIRGSD